MKKALPYIALLPLTIIFLISVIEIFLEKPKSFYFFVFIFGAVIPAVWGLEKLIEKGK